MAEDLAQEVIIYLGHSSNGLDTSRVGIRIHAAVPKSRYGDYPNLRRRLR